MRLSLRLFIIPCLLGSLYARLSAAEASLGTGPGAASIQPSPLAGLWSLSIGGDFASLGNQDLQSFYPVGSLNPATTRLSPGFYLLGRKHVSDSFYAVGALSSLAKGYTVDSASGQDIYQWDTVLLSTGGGWMLYQALNFAFYAQAEAGWLVITQGSFERVAASSSQTPSTKGTFEGSTIATQFSVGGLWFILPSVALDLNGGYRFARLPLRFTTASGQVNPSFTPEFYTDLSGPYGRAGLSFFWGLRNPWGQSDAPPPPKAGPPGTE